jgi:hypothetical protein
VLIQVLSGGGGPAQAYQPTRSMPTPSTSKVGHYFLRTPFKDIGTDVNRFDLQLFSSLALLSDLRLQNLANQNPRERERWIRSWSRSRGKIDACQESISPMLIPKCPRIAEIKRSEKPSLEKQQLVRRRGEIFRWI